MRARWSNFEQCCLEPVSSGHWSGRSRIGRSCQLVSIHTSRTIPVPSQATPSPMQCLTSWPRRMHSYPVSSPSPEPLLPIAAPKHHHHGNALRALLASFLGLRLSLPSKARWTSARAARAVAVWKRHLSSNLIYLVEPSGRNGSKADASHLAAAAHARQHSSCSLEHSPPMEVDPFSNSLLDHQP